MAKVGDTIKIVRMAGEPQYDGREGAVEHIDSIGQLHGTWGGLAVIPGEDEFEINENNCTPSKDYSNRFIKYLVSDIVWDTDGEDAESLGLPSSVELNVPSDEEDVNGAIGNLLSDKFGFCVESFVF